MVFNPFSLEGKNILVTGASSGIGRSIAITVSKMGASVIISGRKEAKLQETLSMMVGGHNSIVKADLTVSDDIHNLVSSLPILDGVVHSAGIGHRVPAKLISESDIDMVMDSNFSGAVLLQASLLKNKKINKNSSIVFIASKAADYPSLGNAIYSASKGAIIAYSRCLALELAPRGIRVNCICPTMVWTDLIKQNEVTEEELRNSEKQYPLKRFGRPEDIAYLSIYLLSDASAWMTSSCIDITGGSNCL
jgi:NAD(P)-dependent dehydrogenase (short-subunit alcohol dehydrogenase family)